MRTNKEILKSLFTTENFMKLLRFSQWLCIWLVGFKCVLGLLSPNCEFAIRSQHLSSLLVPKSNHVKSSYMRNSFISMAIPFNYNRDRGRVSPNIIPLVNNKIRADPVRLIAPKPGSTIGEEEMLGIYPLQEALEKASSMELDLVMINEKADPPVCKIIDLGKYMYALERKKRENAKKQVKGGLKEVKMSYKIDVHDFDVRVRAAQRFLADGDRVKVVIQFKGREMQHQDLGYKLLAKYFERLNDIAVMESSPKTEGRSMFMFIAPKTKKKSEKKMVNTASTSSTSSTSSTTTDTTTIKSKIV